MSTSPPRFLDALWSVWLELAPWLLVGALVAGALTALLPRHLIQRWMVGRGGVLRAVAIGVPLPLCSCGVIPAGLSLRQQGASKGASVGFLISTPQTGVDSALVSASMLGWPFAIFKVVSAAALGVIGGLATDAWGERDAPAEATGAGESEAPRTVRERFREGVEHAGMLIGTLWHWLVFGAVLSAALTTWLPAGAFADLGLTNRFAAMAVMLVIALPLYVCATASVPIAAALVAGGLPTGAALVFLMAGPATNAATIGAVYRTLGMRSLLVYLATVVVGSMGLGLMFDWLLTSGPAHAGHVHDHGAGLVAIGSGVLLAVLCAYFAARDLHDRVRAWTHPAAQAKAGSHVVELKVDGMTCQGCVKKLTRELLTEAGVDHVEVSLELGSAKVEGSAERATLDAAIRRAGFRPA